MWFPTFFVQIAMSQSNIEIKPAAEDFITPCITHPWTLFPIASFTEEKASGD